MPGLLSGLTVVEAASFIAAPSCALHLAQLGATVIRIDQLGGGPDAGRWPLAANGSSHYWEGLNKGKRSVAVDLTQAAGRDLAQRLAIAGDGVFVTNFPRDGFLSYERLAARRPDLICLRVAGWPDGTPAVDYTVNAAVGVPLMTGHPDDPRPVNNVLPAWDLLAGAYGAFTLLAARDERARTGAGRELTISLSDLAATTLGHLGMVAEAIGTGARERTGNDLFGAFGRDFTTADGRRLMIVAITVRQWTGLIAALGIGAAVAALEAQTGADFTADEGARFTHRTALDAIVAGAVAAHDGESLANDFAARGVCWSWYRALPEAIAAEPRLVTRNPLFSQATHPGGTYPTPGAAVRCSREPPIPAAPAPSLGADTETVLTQLLALDAQEIARLRSSGVIG